MWDSGLISIALILAKAVRVAQLAAASGLHIHGIVVPLTERAPAKVRVATGIERALSPVQERVIGAIGANDEVFSSVVVSQPIDMVNLRARWQAATYRGLCHQNVSGDATPALDAHHSIAILIDVAGSLWR